MKTIEELQQALETYEAAIVVPITHESLLLITDPLSHLLAIARGAVVEGYHPRQCGCPMCSALDEARKAGLFGRKT